MIELNEFMLKLENCKSKSKDNIELDELLGKAKKEFENAMDDDFETHNAITVIFGFTKEINKLIAEEKLSELDIKKIKELMLSIDKIFGILETETEIPDEISRLVDLREEARKNKNFKLADELRESIKSQGYYIDDTKGMPIIKKL